MPMNINSADKFVMLHFGFGDLVVFTNLPELKPYPDEVIIFPSPDYTGKIGEDASPLYGGKPTSELPPGIRMIFENEESVQVVIDALLKVQSAIMAHKIVEANNSDEL